MIQYLEIIEHTLKHGTPRYGEKPDRTLTITNQQLKFDLSRGFPLLTCRDMEDSFKNYCVPELLWIISGSTNANDLEKMFGSKLWKRWALDSEKKLGTPPGELGPVYGYYLRRYKGNIDQLSQIIGMLRRTPETRRAEISLWDLDQVEISGVKKVNVANCIDRLHFGQYNYKIAKGKYEPRLDLAITHRSADLIAGVPHDIAVWALMLILVAREVGLKPGTLTDNIDDGQIYDVQRKKVKELLNRHTHRLPRVKITDSFIYSHNVQDFKLQDYNHEAKLFFPVVT